MILWSFQYGLRLRGSSVFYAFCHNISRRQPGPRTTSTCGVSQALCFIYIHLFFRVYASSMVVHVYLVIVSLMVSVLFHLAALLLALSDDFYVCCLFVRLLFVFVPLSVVCMLNVFLLYDM